MTIIPGLETLYVADTPVQGVLLTLGVIGVRQNAGAWICEVWVRIDPVVGGKHADFKRLGSKECATRNEALAECMVLRVHSDTLFVGHPEIPLCRFHAATSVATQS